MVSPAPPVRPPAPEDEEELFRFELPARLIYRDAARAFLAFICDQLAQRGRLPEDAGHRVISAFVESFNNAAIHGYADKPVGQVEVSLRLCDACLEVQVIDDGDSFRPEDVPEPDLESLPEGGLGLFIIRNFMDEVDLLHEGGRNILRMRKRLDVSPALAPETHQT